MQKIKAIVNVFWKNAQNDGMIWNVIQVSIWFIIYNKNSTDKNSQKSTN